MSNNGSQFSESKFPSSTTVSHSSTRSRQDESALREFGPNATHRSVATCGGSEMIDGGAQVRLVAGGLFAKPDLSSTKEGVTSLALKSVAVNGDSGGVGLIEKLGISDARIHVTTEAEAQDQIEHDVSELPFLPSYLESRPSFVSRVGPKAILVLLFTTLPGLNGITVEVRPATGKLKLKGQCYRDGSHAGFLITLHRNQASEVVVVCEKQDGCSLLFAAFFRLLLSRLGDSIVSPGDTSQPPTFACPDDFRSDSTLPIVLDPYMHRARSPFLDVQREAAASLVELSQGTSRARLLEQDQKGELLSAVELFLSADNEELHRLGGVLLKNLLESDPVFAAKIPQSLLARMRALLAGPTNYLNRDSKRQLETALRCIDNSNQEGLSPEQRLALEKRQRVDGPPTVNFPLPLSLSR